MYFHGGFLADPAISHVDSVLTIVCPQGEHDRNRRPVAPLVCEVKRLVDGGRPFFRIHAGSMSRNDPAGGRMAITGKDAKP